MTYATVIADSVNRYGERLISLEIELHRFVLPEFNTHRSFSRNFQSSRAIKLSKQRELVKNNMAIPVWWGRDQPGMQAITELKGVRLALAKTVWGAACFTMRSFHWMLEKLQVHKQLTNRLIEPFMYTKGVATATHEAWLAFLALRDHPEAQPEIQALARAIKEAIEGSYARFKHEGDYHIPYEEKIRAEMPDITLDELIIVSTSACAQVSYRLSDLSKEKAHNIYNRLRLDGVGGPAHASPVEHIAWVTPTTDHSGNFGSHRRVHWTQLRKSLKI